MSKKNIFLSLIAIVLLAIVAISFFGKKANAPEKDVNVDNAKNSSLEKAGVKASKTSDEIIYYYGEECPHCKDVLKFLEENKIAEKVNFQKKEVWNDEANSNEMMEKVSECGLDPKSVGVPFLYAEGKCLIGTPKVEEFFREKAGI
ncbi:MAG: Uncharacterized protein Athens071425_51 [Parcubacteria group bacterium Athens0714_25]|nr:MAG: Uncharacterized protein Athens071425_51 [Parcubacteria group bacterium Athens0714_25]